MSPLHMVIRSNHPSKGKNEQSTTTFHSQLHQYAYRRSLRNTKSWSTLVSTPIYPKHHCSVWRYPHFARLSFYKEKFWDEDVYGSLAEEWSNRRKTCPNVILVTANSTLKFVKHVKIQFVPHRKRYVSLPKTNRLTVLTVGTVHNKNTPCGQNAGFSGKASPLRLSVLVDKTNVN
jgi:hypothetical protein